jgi:hypothetical protein
VKRQTPPSASSAVAPCCARPRTRQRGREDHRRPIQRAEPRPCSGDARRTPLTTDPNGGHAGISWS